MEQHYLMLHQDFLLHVPLLVTINQPGISRPCRPLGLGCNLNALSSEKRASSTLQTLSLSHRLVIWAPIRRSDNIICSCGHSVFQSCDGIWI